MKADVKQAIIKTLAYADVFDYPLTKEEIWKFLINNNKVVSKKQIDKALSGFGSKDGYYFLKGRKSIVEVRKKRELESERKLKIARRIALFISKIPSVNFIGVTGNLAMKNARRSDDIDFFVITKENSLWSTRIFLIVLLKMLRQHRSKFGKKIKDMICINMFMDEQSLCVTKERQNLYTAHEVIQAIPLFDRNNTYRKFLEANVWVKKFLPNLRLVKNLKLKNKKTQNKKIFIMEKIAKIVQLWYMKNNRSTEYVSDTMLAFHPKDYTLEVLKLYKERLNKYGKV